MGVVGALYLTLLAGMTGCNPLANPGECIQKAGEGDSPAHDGPYAVGELKPRVDRVLLSDFNYKAWYPALESGEFDFSAAPSPIAILVPDILIDPSEYQWVGARLASWGITVVSPHLPYGVPELGLLRPSALLDKVAKSQEEDTFWAGGLDLDHVLVMGHGWGAGLADWVDTADTRISGEVLLFGPTWGNPGGKSGPTLLLAGVEDCEASLISMQNTYAGYGPDTLLATFQDMSHRQLTSTLDELWYCDASLDRSTAHQRISSVLVPWAMDVLSLPGPEEWQLMAVDGVSWQAH